MSWGAELLPILAPNSKEIWCSPREVFPAWIMDRHSFNQLGEGNSRLLQMKSRLQKRTWTFWIFSDWKYNQLTVPSPCSLLATYYSYSCLTAITSRPQALLLTHTTSLHITCRGANLPRKLLRGWSPEIPHGSGFPGTGCMRGTETMVNNKMRLHW